MKIAGLNKCSLIDYPGKISAVVFTQGCNLRCGYCHNPQLVYPEKFAELFPQEYILGFLRERTGKLEGLVITGGEPSLQRGLERFMVETKRLGYSIKLDTNGTHPQVLRRLLYAGLCDYVAMDIKAPLEKYSAVCGVECGGAVIDESIKIIEASGADYQFRTTFNEDILTIHDLERIRATLQFPSRHIIQECLPVVRSRVF